MKQKETVIIMAGGTGGHVFPALAVAEVLEPQFNIVWFGTKRGLEVKLLQNMAYELQLLPVAGLRGKGLIKKIVGPFKAGLATFKSMWLMLRYKPKFVLGMGGYVTGPGGLAAWVMRYPLLIHEQNSIPGLTNKILAKFAAKVMQAFPDSFPASTKTLHTGNPVRKAIHAVPDPAARLANRTGPIRILVIGGSLGARSLNQVMPATLKALAEHGEVEAWHQTGANLYTETESLYAAEALPQVKLTAFIEDMAAALGWADIVICRAGALTVAELSAVGVASILIPYPYAVDDHQTSNAKWLERAKAAKILPQQQLTVANLSNLLLNLTNDRSKLLEMAQAARSLTKDDATAIIVAQCLEVG